MAKSRGKSEPQKNTVWVLVILFCLFTGFFLFLRSPYFSIKKFDVSGNNHVSTEEIVARCSQKSPNIFAFDVDKARSSVEASPWVQEAIITRKLPDTIIVKITERTPVAFLPVDGSTLLIDASGRVLGEDDGTFPGLVAFTGLQGPFSPGQYLAESAGWGLKVLANLGQISRQKVTEISVPNGDCVLILDDGCRVFLGKEGDAVQKCALLESILKELAGEGVQAEYIDLRFERQAVKTRAKTQKAG